jgi:hypothetical protein
MYADMDLTYGNESPRSLGLWRRNVEEYVAAKSGG